MLHRAMRLRSLSCSVSCFCRMSRENLQSISSRSLDHHWSRTGVPNVWFSSWWWDESSITSWYCSRGVRRELGMFRLEGDVEFRRNDRGRSGVRAGWGRVTNSRGREDEEHNLESISGSWGRVEEERMVESGGGGWDVRRGEKSSKPVDREPARRPVSHRQAFLSWGWPWGWASDWPLSHDGSRGTASDIDDTDLRLNIPDPSPRLTFSSIKRSPTFRPKLRSSLLRLESLILLVPLPLRLRGDFFFPSIICALGGGCSIHLVWLGFVGCVLTTGGCKSFTAGFRATW
jgi:hypothetical protein